MKNLEQQIKAKKTRQSPNWERLIPIDLLMEIFLRIPATAIPRFCCVSKLWGSILSRPDFTELFLTRSFSWPRLILFTFQVSGDIFFFSSPQPRNLDENSCLVSTRYRVLRSQISHIGASLCGLVCLREYGRVVICNPVTGTDLSLPIVECKSIRTEEKPYLGFDPINKQIKVLCVKFHETSNTADEHQVLTLGYTAATRIWRTIHCKPHQPRSGEICIDGVLYYPAGFDTRTHVSMIVCFDVRSEKFSFIDIDICMSTVSPCTLINYKGKLGALQSALSSPRRLELWVLEDAGIGKWSRYAYTLPSSLWNSIVERIDVLVHGMTAEGEVAMSPYCIVSPFYIYFYNLESASFRRVQIQGFEAFRYARVYISFEYIENFETYLRGERGVY